MAGVDFPTVKERMDHKDITMTLRHTHLFSDYKQHTVITSSILSGRLHGLGSVPAIFTIGCARDAAMLSYACDCQNRAASSTGRATDS